MSLYIGLMSGTSMDGIDAALVDVETHQLLKGITRPYSTELRAALQELMTTKKVELGEVYQINTRIGREFAAVANELIDVTSMTRENIVAIGSHGQTICHEPLAAIPYTVQLGCPHTIVEMTKIPVVADFRTRDLVLGGQGAPLAPLYHQALFFSLGYPLAIVNVGGIANISILLAPRQAEESSNTGKNASTSIIGYDVGPGNCLMDAWIQHCKGELYDFDGHWASQGQVIRPLLEQLLMDPFMQKAYPKSIGKEYYSLHWLKQSLDASYIPADVQATLLQWTAEGIAQAVKTQSISFKQVLLCGGGAHNRQLLAAVARLLPQMVVQSTAALDIDPDFVEAQMMAWLAHQMLSKKALNLPAVTGALHQSLLGVLYPYER